MDEKLQKRVAAQQIVPMNQLCPLTHIKTHVEATATLVEEVLELPKTDAPELLA